MFGFIFKNIDFAHKLDKPSSPNEEYYKHIHYFNEIIYLVNGNVDYSVETETHHLNHGDLVFIPSGNYHFATVDSNVPYERYVLKFPDSFVPEYIKEKLNTCPHFFPNSKKYEVIFNLLDRYEQQYPPEERYTMFVCEVIKLLVMLCHEPWQTAKKHDDFIVQLIDFIDDNLQNSLNIQTLTDKFHYSKSFINNEFKRRMRITVMQYIRYKKIVAAHHMILNGAKKSEAAELYGFETYSTFYRLYKNFLESNDNF